MQILTSNHSRRWSLQRKSFIPWTPDSEGRWLPCVEKNVWEPPPALMYIDYIEAKARHKWSKQQNEIVIWMFGFMVWIGSDIFLDFLLAQPGTTAGNITVTMVVVTMDWFAYNHLPAGCWWHVPWQALIRQRNSSQANTVRCYCLTELLISTLWLL